MPSLFSYHLAQVLTEIDTGNTEYRLNEFVSYSNYKRNLFHEIPAGSFDYFTILSTSMALTLVRKTSHVIEKNRE